MSVYQELVGQEHVIEILQNAVHATRTQDLDSTVQTNNQMTHAWVFTGPPGSGRSNAAIAFAQGLICPNNSCGA